MAPKHSEAEAPIASCFTSAKGRNGNGSQVILTHQIQRLLGKVPPAGHSYRLLSLWLERHALERRLELQHHAGGLADRFPDCPRSASLQVDRITLRIDSINALLTYLAAGAVEVAG